VRLDYSRDEGVAYTVLDWHAVDNRRRDEELVLNVDKVLGQLDRCSSARVHADSLSAHI